MGFTDFMKTLPGTEYQISLFCLRLMSGLLLDKFLAIFIHNHLYKRDRFRMWGRILEKDDP